jgi:hypothetical protein
VGAGAPKEEQPPKLSRREGNHQTLGTEAPTDEKRKIRELEAKLKAREKALADERENVEILKKCLHIFMQARD